MHTEYSLLDGACRIGELLDRAKELGMESLAITDHGNMYGAIDFYRAAKERGIRPILGCECYVAARSRFDKDKAHDGKRYHLVLLCENETGWRNLCALVSEAWVDGFYTKPRVDRALLEKYHEGLICLSACLAGELPQAILNGEYEKAKQTALWYQRVFGAGNYYIEIQDHGLPEQARVLPQLLRLVGETGIPPVATNDVHYLRKQDARVQQVLICIQTNHVVGEDTGMEFGADEFYLKSEEEMRALFRQYPQMEQAIDNTAAIAARCRVEIEFGNTRLPHFELPGGLEGKEDHFSYLRRKCEEGLARHYGDPPQTHRDRLRYELEIIRRMGFVDYFLIVHDFIAYAKSAGIPVGPGRGSGAGSLAAYCIGITGIDPMQYQLLFERFLNPERVSMPDFDIDFCYKRRGEVIEYVIEKYGADHVAQIVTFGTMKAKAALRDVGRALGVPYAAVDQVAKRVPGTLDITLEKAIDTVPELRSMMADPKIEELVYMARQVEGMPRHASTHAAGVVITREPVQSYVPLARNDASAVTQFTMTTLEELGLLKMDFLGLRTLTVLHDAEQFIRQMQPDFALEAIPKDDAATFAMFARGETTGVFQFEANWVRTVLTKLRPESIEDLATVTSMCRPGPMESIPTVLANRHAPERIKYHTPELAPILRVTYGCLLYQEQVMQVLRELAGYSLGRADIVRRAMSKKKHKVMEQEREIFLHGLVNEKGEPEVEGCARRGVPLAAANKIFDEMAAFASYAFNKSHAAAYAYVAYQTAYCKCHFPKEFLAATLSSEVESSAKVAEYGAECARLGIPLLPPSVNDGALRFTVEPGGVRFGLLAVKNLGAGLINGILAEREKGGRFTSFYSFLKRMQGRDCNRRAVEALIRCGALDGLDGNRRSLLMALDGFLAELETDARRNVEGQVGFLEILAAGGAQKAAATGEPKPPPQKEFKPADLLAGEKETMGFYLSGHPLAALAEEAARLGAASIASLLDPANKEGVGQYRDEESVLLLCVITGIKKKAVKNNAAMAFLTVEDRTGQLECLLFPSGLERFANLVQAGRTVLLAGRLSLQEGKDAKVLVNSIEDMEDVQSRPEEPASPATKIFLRFAGEADPRIAQAERLLALYPGQTPMRYYYAAQARYTAPGEKPGAALAPALCQALTALLGAENVIAK